MAFAPKPAAKAKAKPADEVERPDVELHDEVYFRHEAGPKCGRVVAHGKHGATVHADGQHHKVKWEHILGHKMKVQPQVRVIDQGADGMIVEDAAGRRRYVHDPIGDGPPPMTKSLLPRILFFDAGGELAKAMGGIKNRPGLSQKDVTDKNGRTSKRWVRTNKDQPKARRGGKGGSGGGKGGGGGDEPPKGESAAGDAPTPRKAGEKVSFQLGSLRGHGQIVGEPGKDGATVEDASGHRHKVLYSQMTSQEAMAGTGVDKRAADEPASRGVKHDEAHDDPDQIARTLFDTSELEKLPAKENQPVDNWDELLAKGKVGLEEYKSMLGHVAKALHLVTGKRPASLDFAQQEENHKAKEEGRAPENLKADDYMLPEHWDDPHGYLFLGPLKGKKRAMEKVQADYTDADGNQDWSQIRDMVRATIAVPSMTQVPVVLKALRDAGIEPAQKPKNNFVKPLPGGYRDVNMIVRLPNGLLAEMQIHVKPMTLAKEKGHKHYETSRTIEAKYKAGGEEVPREKWDAGDSKAHGAAMTEQERIYGEAWDNATRKHPKK